MTLRYGILSTSSITPRFIAAAKASRCSEVAAIASRDALKAAQKALEWGVPKSYGSYEELLAAPDIDVIYVSMVNHLHYQYAKAALETGHHVLCEKPFTLSETQSTELFALARSKGKFIMEAEKVVFLPVMQEIRRRIADGQFGRVTLADFSSSFAASYNNWFLNPKMGGGPFYGNAIYSLQLLSYLFDSEIADAKALCTTLQQHDDPSAPEELIEDQFAVMYRLNNGTLAVNKTSVLSQTCHSAYLYGEKGMIEVPSYWKARKALIRMNDGTEEEINFPCDHELVYEIDHVAECIENGLLTSPIMTEKRTVDAIHLIDRLRKEMLNYE